MHFTIPHVSAAIGTRMLCFALLAGSSVPLARDMTIFGLVAFNLLPV